MVVMDLWSWRVRASARFSLMFALYAGVCFSLLVRTRLTPFFFQQPDAVRATRLTLFHSVTVAPSRLPLYESMTAASLFMKDLQREVIGSHARQV